MSGVIEYGFGKVVVILADVFEQLQSVGPSQIKAARPESGVRPRVIDQHVIFQRSGIGPRKFFGEMKPVGMGESISAHPKFFIEADSIDDQSVSLPAPDGIPVI